jgi:glycosyltransferase involved in cell wall biosynthesis
MVSKTADMTVFVAEADRRLADHWNILKHCQDSVVIRNGIDLSTIRPASSHDDKKIGFLGRLTFQKDPLLFLEVLRRLSPRGYSAKIIGGGDMEGTVRRYIREHGIEDQVTLTGELSHSDALEAIRDLDVLLMTSRWEGLPRAPLEAMYAGIPVAAPAINGIPEIIADNQTGRLVRHRSPEAFASAVKDLCENPKLRQRTISEGRRMVKRDFSQKRVLMDHLSLYERIRNARSRQCSGVRAGNPPEGSVAFSTMPVQCRA